MEDMTVEFRFVILGAGSIAVKFADAVRKTRNCSLLEYEKRIMRAEVQLCTIAMKNERFLHAHYTLRQVCFQSFIGSFSGSYRLTKADPIFDV